MEIGISGSETIRRPPAEIWCRITDPSRLMAALSGLELLKVGEERFNIAFRLRAGLLRGLFRGVLEFQDLTVPESCRVRIDARGRPGGIAGWTLVKLRPEESGQATHLEFETLVTVSGLLKAAGAQLTRRIGKSLIESFLSSVKTDSSRGGG